MIPLGSVNLTQRIGHGGMGTVWVGIHKRDRVAVAVKVLTGEFATDDGFQQAFREEVRAVASLDDPHIVMVYDHGRVGAESAARSEGALQVGAPYLVMELVPHGTLAEHLGKMRWTEVRRILLELLEALAHAHARGVLHRDLKPENVLLTGTGSVKLSDFGLSHALDEVDDKPPMNAGTPAYMAPEQFDCRWRDYGPWTDLYALGCVAWAMVHGEPPFGTGLSWATLRLAHLERPPPPMRPSLVLPAGFEECVRRLLEKDPAHRYRRAADVARELESLGSTTGGAPIPTLRSLDSTKVIRPTMGDVITLRRPEALDTLILDRDDTADRAEPPLSLAGAIAWGGEPPVDWRQERPPAARPLGTGLGLLGLRIPPMVDRDGERDLLWNALRRVSSARRPELVMVHGAAGTGKSRLAGWLAERAHEVGAAIVLRATHRPTPGPAHGLRGLVTSALRCAGLGSAALDARLRRLMDDRDAPVLAELIRPGSSGRSCAPTERYAAVIRILRRMVVERPVVVWLDDVQWGLDAARFAQWLLALDATGLPVLLVATAVDEQVAAVPEVQALLGRLRELDAVTDLELEPLPREHRPAMIRALLGMSGSLAAQIEARSSGNPQFAVQLVESLVQRGLVVPGPRGLRLKGGADLDLPPDLLAVWSQRVEKVLARTGFAEAVGIELAAVLGQDVDGAEWEAACEIASAIAGGTALDALLDQRLIRPSATGIQAGWHFVHGGLCEALLARAARAGRLVGHHGVCAEVLLGRRRGERLPAGVAERAGRHLLEAGRPEESAGPLLQGATERMELGDYDAALVLIQTRDRALGAAGIPDGDPLWAEGWLLAAQVARHAGDYPAIASWLDRVDAGAARGMWEEPSVRAACLRGELHLIRGEAPEAIAALRAAELGSRRVGDRRLAATVRFHLGEALSSGGAHDEAAELLASSLAEFEEVPDPLGAACALQGIAELAKERGEHERALALFAETRARLLPDGDPWRLASVLNSSGDVLRYLGRLDEALRAYQESAEVFRRIGSDSVVFPEYNAALAHLERGELGAAGDLLKQALLGLERLGGKSAVGDCHFALAACAAGELGWAEFDRHVETGEQIVAQTGMIDIDTARVAELAGALAFRAGEVGRAGRAWVVAAAQWRGLGREDHVADLERQLARCDPD